MKTLQRQSNMELLRVIAMFMVLVVHSDFAALGLPDKAEFTTGTIPALWRTLVESAALVCVNLFILISGYFSIKLKWKSMANFLFQVLFWSTLPYVGAVLVGLKPWDTGLILNCLAAKDYWFPQEYLLLMLLSPALNAFTDNRPSKEVATVIVAFLVVECTMGWLDIWPSVFRRGYSVLSFIGLYLIGRYISTTGIASAIGRTKSLTAYMACTLLTTAGIVAATCLIGQKDDAQDATYVMMSYASPFVILASISLLVLFTKFRFQSKIVNQLGASAFAVYLIHVNSYVMYPAILLPVRTIYSKLNALESAIIIPVYLIAIFLFCVLLDRVRQLIWEKGLAKLLFAEKHTVGDNNSLVKQ